jgi:sec-independent protein translocase protein TatB
MFDFSLGELAMIGAVALIVLGPERLPKVARSLGEWIGKAQRYVAQVKSEINREMELAELKKLQEEARAAAQSIQSGLQGAVDELKSEVNSLKGGIEAGVAETSTDTSTETNAWEGAGQDWQSPAFPRRYRSGPSVDELAEELARLKRELALPDSYAATRRKYAPRARLNRPRIRR